MRSRGLVVAVAVVLAALAAGAVILYTNGVKEDARSGGELTTVIVAVQEIPANSPLNPLVDSGAFKELAVPNDAVVQNAVTSLEQLRDTTTTAPILANEQISSSNLSTGEAPAGGSLGISKGHVAMTIKLNAPQGGYGNIQRGDNISIYATFNGVSVIPASFQELLSGQAADAERQELPDFTVTLIPTAKVLWVQNPTVDEEGNATGGEVVLALDSSAGGRAAAHVRVRERADLDRPPASGRGRRADPAVDGAGGAPDREEKRRMTEASVVAVGTPQSFRQQIARALEVETDEIGWVQSATAAEELLINAYNPVDVLVLSPEVKEPDALGLAEFMGRQAPGTAIVLVRDHTWNGLLPAAMRAGSATWST